MEIATLTARLEADIAAFQRNLAAADTLLAQTRKQADDLSRALKDVKVPAQAAAETVAATETEKRALKALEDAAARTAAAEAEVKVPLSAAAETVAALEAEKRAMKSTEDQAWRLQAAMMALASTNLVARDAGYNSPSQLAALARERAVQSGYAGLGDYLNRRAGLFAEPTAAASAPLGLTAEQQRSMFEAATRDAAVRAGLEGLAQQFGARNALFGSSAAASAAALAEQNRFAGRAPIQIGGGEDLAGRFERDFGRLSSGILTSESSRGRDGLFGMLFGARGAAMAERVGSAVERETARMFGAGSGGTNFTGRGLLGGVLPGGARASAGFVTTLLGIGLGAAPSGGAAIAGLGAGASAALEGLIGGAATLKLAFADITSAAFTTQKAFNALTPAQQAFVQTLRSLDAGLVRGLEGIAQRTVFPGLTAGLRSAFTPASTGALAGGVAAFGGAIGGGAQQLGQLFGSTQFAKAFGDVLQADARYLRDMINGATRLLDAFVHLQQAAIPLTDWLDKGALALAKMADNSVLAAQKSGALARFFDNARLSIEAWGHALGALGSIFTNLFSAIGIQNSIDLVNTLGLAFQSIANFIQRNRNLIRNFFAGAVAAARDAIRVIDTLIRALQPLLDLINKIAGAVGGWRTVIDTIAAVWVAKMLTMRLATAGVVTETVTLTGALGKAGLLGAVGLASFEITTLILHLTGLDSKLRSVGGALQSFFADHLGLGQQAPDMSGQIPQAQFTQARRQVERMRAAGASQARIDATLQSRFPGLGPNEFSVLRQSGAATFGGVFTNAVAAITGALGTVGRNTSTSFQGLGTSDISAFGKPAPLQGTGRSGVLPAALEAQIAQQESNVAAGGPKAPLIAAIQAGIAYIEKNVGGVKDRTLATQYYQERTALYNELSSLTQQTSGAAGPQPTGALLIPQGIQARITAAQQAAAVAGRNLIGGDRATMAGPGEVVPAHATTPQIQANQRLLSAQTDALRNIQQRASHEEALLASLKAQGAAADKINAAQRALNALQREAITLGHEREATEKRINSEQERANRLAQTAARVAELAPTLRRVGAAQARLAGLPAITATSPFSHEALQAAIGLSTQLEEELRILREQGATEAKITSIRKQLAEAQKKVGEELLAQHTGLVQTRMEHILGVAGGVPGLASIRTSLRRTEARVEAARNAGEPIGKATLNSLEKIHQVLSLAQKEHVKLNDLVSQNLTARLAQINDTLKQDKNAYHSNFRVPTEREITAGMNLTPEQRKRVGARLAEVEELGGKVAAGPAALGIDLGPHGHTLHLADLFPRDFLATHPSDAAGRSAGTVVHGDVNIYVQSHASDAAAVAREVKTAFTKMARRNATQTRGPNAGRNLGHN